MKSLQLWPVRKKKDITAGIFIVISVSLSDLFRRVHLFDLQGHLSHSLTENLIAHR